MEVKLFQEFAVVVELVVLVDVHLFDRNNKNEKKKRKLHSKGGKFNQIGPINSKNDTDLNCDKRKATKKSPESC